jgi:phosphopantothenoylcysteine decarboxylase
MNTLMWRSPLTRRQLGQILLDHGAVDTLPLDFNLENAPEHFAQYAANLILIPPQSKRLACGDVGIGAMADVTRIAEVVRGWSESSAEPG